MTRRSEAYLGMTGLNAAKAERNGAFTERLVWHGNQDAGPG